MILAILAVVTATIQPPAPHVGDLITVEFSERATVLPSPEYEIVSQNGRRAVVRTFTPKAFTLRGPDVLVPVQSVLKPNDDMKPAPLVPPRDVPYPREPFIAIGIALLCALASWVLVWWRSRGASSAPVVPISAEDAFRDAVLALRRTSQGARWAALADATRAYLAATRPALGSELTTSELLSRIGPDRGAVEEILQQGDLEKFSPWGARAMNFDDLAERALQLIPKPSVEEAA
jgi:hypothetical protein